MRFAAGIAAGLLLSGAMAAPAEAAPSGLRQCEKGNVCFWTEPNYKGEISVFYEPGNNCDAAYDGVIRSAANRSGKRITLYEDQNCEVPLVTLWDKVEIDDVGLDAQSWI
ncbi:peptidase inhibitor family I36 protein [Glycomyces tarimensis]